MQMTTAFPTNPISLHRRSEEHTSELQSLAYLVCRLLLEKKNSSIARGTPSCRLPLRAPTWVPSRQASTVLFFFNDTTTTEIYTLSLHDALPILMKRSTITHRE